MVAILIALLMALLIAVIVGFVVHQIKPEWEHFAFIVTFLLVFLYQLGALR